MKKSISPSCVIGNRIKSVRMLAGYSRKAFAEKSGISGATLRAWEEPVQKRNGITQKGAIRLVQGLQESGISCTLEWLLEGKGPGPSLLNSNPINVSTDAKLEISWNEEESIFKDIESFKINNPNPIVAIITDGSMLPFYSYSDYVGGSKKTGNEIASLVGLNCIIELEDLTIVRRITSSNSQGKYTVRALNIDPSVTQPVIENVEILSAAHIIWHRSRQRLKTIII